MAAISVTGHRFLAEVDRIAAGVDEALNRIEETFPDRPLTLISHLAEGVDRQVVARALKRSRARLVVSLPLPQFDYMADFESPESKAESLTHLAQADEVIELTPAPTREQAYPAAGRYLLDHCDVLLAIWDGQPAQSEGGAGEVVAQARRRDLPPAWVHAGNRRPGTQEPTTLGKEQGRVSFERFPEQGPPREEEKEDG